MGQALPLLGHKCTPLKRHETAVSKYQLLPPPLSSRDATLRECSATMPHASLIKTAANPRAATRSFIKDDSGATTVDWVVLAAAITGLGIGAATMVRSGSGDLATDINNSLASASVANINASLGLLAQLWTPLSPEYSHYRELVAAMDDTELVRWFNEYSEQARNGGVNNSVGLPAGYLLDAYASLQIESESRGMPLPDGLYDIRHYLSQNP